MSMMLDGLRGDRCDIEMSIDVDGEDLKYWAKAAAIGAIGILTLRILYRLHTDEKARKDLAEFLAQIGLYTRSVPVTLASTDKKYPLSLHSVTPLNHNVSRLRFQLPSDDHVIGVPPGQHVALSAVLPAGRRVLRMYSPVSSSSLRGFVDLVIKKYDNEGALSRYIHSLAEGDSIDFSGPRGHILFKGRGLFVVKKGKTKERLGKFHHISMIAGGTGLTPMIQVLRTALEDHSDSTTIHLLFANTTEQDVFMRDELDSLAELYAYRFKVTYTVSQPGPTWGGATGRADTQSNISLLSCPSPQHVILICGPNPMVAAVQKTLKEQKHSERNILVF